MSMSRLIAAVVRNSDPMPPSPPWLDTAAANSADVAEPIGARMIGTSMPRMSQRDVFSIAPPPLGLERHLAREGNHNAIQHLSSNGFSSIMAIRKRTTFARTAVPHGADIGRRRPFAGFSGDLYCWKSYPDLERGMTRRMAVAVLCGVVSATSAVPSPSRADTSLLNVSYEPTRRFYSDVNKAF